MRRNMIPSWLVWALVFLLLPVAAMSQRRTALVIGNASYTRDPLRTPINDATDMTATLEQLGFHVTSLYDVRQQTMEEALVKFTQDLHQQEVGFFYFAGHGVEVHGEHFLLPISPPITDLQGVYQQALPLRRLLEVVEAVSPVPMVVVLATSRNNPFPQSGKLRPEMLIPLPQHTYIAYATAPGGVALEGTGRNSIYTKHLLQHITTPGMSLQQIFKRVRFAVHQETEGKQAPWETTSSREDFSLTGAMQPIGGTASRQAGFQVQEGNDAFHRGDYATAYRELLTAAEQGDIRAQMKLAQLYQFGRGVPRDYAEAAKWHRKAAEQGDAFAQMALAQLYQSGRGVPRDYAEAVKWYRKAAEQGVAQVELAQMYRRGKGIPRDDAEAAKWYQKAAEQGISDAQVALGLMYSHGQGVPQDNIQAHKWYLLTALHVEPGKECTYVKHLQDCLTEQMTPAQIAQATQLAVEWEHHYHSKRRGKIKIIRNGKEYIPDMCQTLSDMMTEEPLPSKPRTALVIGNATYPSAALRHPHNDAMDIKEILERLHFTATLVLDATYQQMQDAIKLFSAQLKPGGIGVFYYGGHGIAIDDEEQYLIPIDAQLEKMEDLRTQAVDVSWITRGMEAVDNELKLLILNTARQNPFREQPDRRTSSASLAWLPENTLLAYATKPGDAILDGDGRNSPFVKHLLRHVVNPDLSLNKMFVQVRLGVREDTQGQQLVWTASSFAVGCKKRTLAQ